MGSSPQVVDWNSDGRFDIVSGDRNGFFNVFVARDDTLLEAHLQYRLMDSTVIDIGGNSQPAVVDWNGDGKKDLLLGTEAGYIRFYANLADDTWPMFQTCDTIEADGTPIYAYRVNPYVFDLDRDGVQDLVCGANDGYVRFYRNTGTNAEPVLAKEESLRTTAGTAIKPPGNYYGSRCGFGYWDGDSVPDFLLSGYDGTVALFRGAVETAVEELTNSGLRMTDAVTFVRGVLHFPASPVTARTSLCDMTGRQVMLLRPGANDVRSLAPGIYFVSGSQAQTVRKVVVQH